MTDRIKEPWGRRTPFGPGEDWPVRVDQYLEEGVSEAEVDRWVQTASILHSNGDALDIAVKDGRIVGVRGRGIDRVNKGRVDPKDLFGWQANRSADRLKRPLVRENGELVEASWDEAMGRVVERSKALLEEKGPLAFGFYTTGQLFLEEYYTLGVIGKAGLGTPHMDGNTRLCTATAAEAPSNLSAPMANPVPTPMWTTPIPSASTATTWPRHRQCSGCGCWTVLRDRIRRSSWSWTLDPPRLLREPTCIWRSRTARTWRS